MRSGIVGVNHPMATEGCKIVCLFEPSGNMYVLVPDVADSRRYAAEIGPA